MNYKILFILFLFILSACKIDTINSSKIKYNQNKYENKGFALIYSDELLKKKIIKKKIDDRSLFIYHDYLNKGTKVKITNLINKKSLVAQVDKKIKNINFYNSVLSKRIFTELEIDISQPYVEIVEIKNNSVFIAKKTKTFDEEKKVANKAPVEEISIKNLNSNTKSKNKPGLNKPFLFSIKIADFYFEENAINLRDRIISETLIKNVKILKKTKNKHRVYIGPYRNINSLQNKFYSINNLGFENIEILRHEDI